MPNWKTHNKWSVELGIDKATANWVNKREDLPQFESSNDKGLQAFRQTMPETQPTYDEMKDKGNDYLKAWILHIVLDEIEDTYEYLIEEQISVSNIEKEIKDMVLNTPLSRLIPDDIYNFVFDNFRYILSDIKAANIKIGLAEHFNSKAPKS